jgi:hypothetical protein
MISRLIISLAAETRGSTRVGERASRAPLRRASTAAPSILIWVMSHLAEAAKTEIGLKSPVLLPLPTDSVGARLQKLTAIVRTRRKEQPP